MKTLSAFLAVLAATSIASASSLHDSTGLFARHHARRNIGTRDVMPMKRADGQRCKQRPLPEKTPEETKPAPEEPEENNGGNNNGGNNNTGEKHPLSVQFDKNGGSYAGSCSDKHATSVITRVSGPNGGEDYLNCGLTGGGWKPPFMGIQDFVTVPLDKALQQDGTPYSACGKYLQYFDAMESELGIPAIMIAAIAMQESSCNKDTVGQGGEQGIMQITREKCQGRSDSECRDPKFNISTGAKYFAQKIKDSNGNVLLALGNYNGWYAGLTEKGARAARWTNCCRCQNNMDYLMAWSNGWILNHNVYSNDGALGYHKNLNDCE